MFRVELGEEINRRGVWSYTVPCLGVEGRSHQPLLDARRQIQRILGPTAQRAVRGKVDLFFSIFR